MRYALLTLMLAASPAMGQNQQAPDRVGQISITGNSATPDRVILRQLGLRPGQILDYGSLEDARMRLDQLRIFDDSDPPIIDVTLGKFNDSFKDIRIRVKERPNSCVVFLARQVQIAMANFDPDRMWGNSYDRVRDDFSEVWRKLSGTAP